MKKYQKIVIFFFIGILQNIFAAEILEQLMMDLKVYDAASEYYYVGTGALFEECLPESYEQAFERYNRVFPDVYEAIEARERLSQAQVEEIKERVKKFCQEFPEYIAERMGGSGWTLEELIAINYIWLKHLSLIKNFENRSLQEKWMRWVSIMHQFPLHVREVLDCFGFKLTSLNQKDVYYSVKKMASEVCKQKMIILISLARSKPGYNDLRLILDKSTDKLSYHDFVLFDRAFSEYASKNNAILGGFYQARIIINDDTGILKSVLLYDIESHTSRMVFFLVLKGKPERFCGSYNLESSSTELLDLLMSDSE